MTHLHQHGVAHDGHEQLRVRCVRADALQLGPREHVRPAPREHRLHTVQKNN
jgi:hypothetical protein